MPCSPVSHIIRKTFIIADHPFPNIWSLISDSNTFGLQFLNARGIIYAHKMNWFLKDKLSWLEGFSALFPPTFYLWFIQVNRWELALGKDLLSIRTQIFRSNDPAIPSTKIRRHDYGLIIFAKLNDLIMIHCTVPRLMFGQINVIRVCFYYHCLSYKWWMIDSTQILPSGVVCGLVHKTRD